MLSLFQRKKAQPIIIRQPASTVELTKGLLRPEPAASLLATPRRQRLLEHIWQRTSLSRNQFTTLYRKPLERYAALVQLLPASESHHHAYPGGLLDHGLEIVAFALKLRQAHLLPAGATPEDQVSQAEPWTAAVAYAALLHDIGKIAVDLHIEYEDGKVWHPWHGPLTRPYRFRYQKDREYRLHGAATGLLYGQVLDCSILDWLSDYPTLWASLIYVLAGQYEHAGVLGELVVQADQASVAQSLGGDPARAMTAPKNSLQRKLVDGLRYLLRDELKLNQAGPSDGWLDQDALWLVSKTVSDKLRAYLLSQGIEGIPSSNTAVFNVLQEHGILLPTPEGRAIWKATITSETGWSHSFTLLRLSPALIWEHDKRPSLFSGNVELVQDAADSAVPPQDSTVPNTTPPETSTVVTGPGSDRMSPIEGYRQPMVLNAVEDLLDLFDSPDEVPPPSQTTTQSASSKNASESSSSVVDGSNDTPAIGSGEHFMTWLKQGLLSHKLIINDAKALVHTVNDTLYLVSPGLFQRYAQEHPQIDALAKREEMQNWLWMQRRFEKLKLHRKQQDGLNIWTCMVTGPRKTRRLHGYMLEDPRGVLNITTPNNPYLSLMKQEHTETQ
ncbi:MobH family relaxase [Serratia sp. 1D1416]|uniref:MobH family relaxase n=1 Tax=Serratia sp. 1D1416 TaxID=2447890 RepID=UPI001013C57B|nr:MobH family relaxase [Serratia sp. 1D1416]